MRGLLVGVLEGAVPALLSAYSASAHHRLLTLVGAERSSVAMQDRWGHLQWMLSDFLDADPGDRVFRVLRYACASEVDRLSRPGVTLGLQAEQMESVRYYWRSALGWLDEATDRELRRRAGSCQRVPTGRTSFL